MSSLIADYLADFDRHLAFDANLKRRAHEEIACHLSEAAEGEQGVSRDEAERLVTKRFGSAAHIAADMIQANRPVRERGARNIAIALILALFLFMRLRAMWMDDGLILQDPTFAEALWIDRVAFVSALIFGAAGWIFAARKVALYWSHAIASASALSIAAGGYIAVYADGNHANALLCATVLQCTLLLFLVARLRLLGHYHAIIQR